MRQDWFPTPIWHFQFPNTAQLNQNLLKAIAHQRNADPEGTNFSNVLGWHSSDQLHKQSDFQPLVEMINYFLPEVVRDLAWDNEEVKPFISNCWAIVNGKNASNVLHNHCNAYLSGVYYVKAPRNSGNLYFHDPRVGAQMLVPPYDKITPITLSKLIYQPSEGMLVIFPSWLWHGVEINQSEEERVSMSFNVITVKP
ncbi:MAG: TIGR02466 family protein [Pseudanabaenaceae cyanobacterium bins.68]|nr:TIGR02466 family protein [Pseudanabaenaceae cyanobacterium bins.68]